MASFLPCGSRNLVGWAEGLGNSCWNWVGLEMLRSLGWVGERSGSSQGITGIPGFGNVLGKTGLNQPWARGMGGNVLRKSRSRAGRFFSFSLGSRSCFLGWWQLHLHLCSNLATISFYFFSISFSISFLFHFSFPLYFLSFYIISFYFLFNFLFISFYYLFTFISFYFPLFPFILFHLISFYLPLFNSLLFPFI